MKDLYLRLGLLPNVDAEAIRARIKHLRSNASRSAETEEACAAGEFILLTRTRRSVYDRHHACLSVIGDVREKLGLVCSPGWDARGCADFCGSSHSIMKSANRGLWRALAASAGMLLTVATITYLVNDAGRERTSPRATSDSLREDGKSDLNNRHSGPATAGVQRPESAEQIAARQRETKVRALVNRRMQRQSAESGDGKQTRIDRIVDEVFAEAIVDRILNEQPEPLPPTGVLSSDYGSRGVAPLRIVTAVGKNYYVKLVVSGSKKTVMSAFVRGGDAFDTLVPLGSYDMRYAVGDSWYGQCVDFGEQASYVMCEERFDFRAEADHYTGYTVELILQVNGNLKTSPILEDDF